MFKTMALIGYIIGSTQGSSAMHTMHLTSPAFENHHHIPIQYSCKGKDISIPLHWTQVPKGTRSLVLIMEDGNAPNGIWYHWGLYNIPATTHRLKAGQKQLATNEHYVLNSWSNAAYQGPCPAQGTHAYSIRLYALDTQLNFHSKKITIDQVEDAMIGHILAAAELKGIFSR